MLNPDNLGGAVVAVAALAVGAVVAWRSWKSITMERDMELAQYVAARYPADDHVEVRRTRARGRGTHGAYTRPVGGSCGEGA